MEFYVILLLCLASFIAGFIDAIVGGGGLIQTPAALILLPNISVAHVIGTLKVPAFSGTSIATYQFLKKVKINWKLFGIMALVSFVFAYVGSSLLNVMKNDFMKPVLFIILVLLLIYTYLKKDFGQFQISKLSKKRQYIYTMLICVVIGFYDGFIGPGTGSLLIMAFIAILGFDFLKASAYAKLVNLATNIGSITLFVIKGKIIWAVAIPMAICNALGAWIGARLAISKGNGFIRVLFLVIVGIALLRFGYDVFLK
ncbi:membrane protein [Flavobacterium sp. 316]|uniref:Probable membrane transporter protein n=1 Tax=Flavobacterium sediminilitoris TaxID=2024526 RepID=A0ABY4HSP1_9FLAO|nr:MULTISPECIES: TSUP family transporter [Flavobacterium]KIX22275.1 membrane protein [Flavobacterium sp. 316]UOX35630.1 TSUP family transporter [Flavobacterium sediminilitoris]